MTSGDDYLWDRSGAVDEDVRRLEELLPPLAHDGRGFDDPDSAPDRAPVLRRRLFGWLAAAAALLVAAGAGAWFAFHEPGPRLVVAATGERLRENAEFVATETHNQLLLDDYGDFRFRPGSRVKVERVAAEQTSLFLRENGEMHAFVGLDAKPEFFQVGTPATRCVDLGCEYTLEVDADGNAFVRVLLGRVAFRNNGREVWIPADAICYAGKEHGAGTPYFEKDAPALASAVRDFDAARDAPPETRRRLAEALLSSTTEIDHALPVYNLLQDPDREVALKAVAALNRIDPTLTDLVVGQLPDDETRERWRNELFGYNW